MKKILIILFSFLLLTPVVSFSKTSKESGLLSSLKLGIGLGLGFHPVAAYPSREIDEQNALWIEAQENKRLPTPGATIGAPIYPSAQYTVNEIGKPTAILPSLKAILTDDIWIVQFTFSFFTSVGGGKGDFKIQDAANTYTEELEASASGTQIMLTLAPKLKIGNLGSIYIGTGFANIGITFTETKTVLNNNTIDTGESYEREWEGSRWYMPLIIGMETELTDNIALSSEIHYRSGTIQGKYTGKYVSGSTIQTTDVISLDYTGLTFLLGANMYFSL